MKVFKSILQIFVLCFVLSTNLYADNQKLDLKDTQTDATLIGGFMNPTVVSFATEGMWAQAKILENINITGKFEVKGLGAWVPLMYLVSIAAAIMMLALGQSPKMAMWFVLGPGIYYFLIDTQVDAKGAGWIAGTKFVSNMEPVWKLAEVGMTNSAMVNIAGKTYDSKTGPSGTTKVSWFFKEYDELLTGTIQTLIDWTGIYNQRETKHLKDLSGSTNMAADWYLMTNYKWKLLNDITSATVKDQNVRDALVYFMSSKCGDMISSRVDSGSYMLATNTKGTDIPDTLFRSKYTEILEGEGSLFMQTVPMPIPVRSLVKETPNTAVSNGTKVNSFYNFISKSQGQPNGKQPKLTETYNANKDISCTSYLWIIMQAFRYEAANTFLNLTLINQEYSIEQKNVIYSLLYGWSIEKNGAAAKLETAEEQKNFVINLILAHMFRNEMTMARKPVDVAYSSSQDLTRSSDTYIRNLGGKSKWSDLFTAFKIFPHIQGLLAYFIILAFPIAVMMMVLPSGWKSLLTWMGFYAYIKSWDVGFALAASIERSVWARIGNSDRTATLNSNILSLFKDPVNAGNTINAGDLPITISAINLFKLKPDTQITPGAGYRTDEALYHFDRLLALSNVLDYDLNNSYYIYIMSAVYMAVPTLLGQLFLKGKASMVSGLMDAGKALGQDGSKAAMQVAQSKMLTDADNTFQTSKQADYVKAMTDKNSFARDAMASQKTASMEGLNKQVIGMRQKNLGDIGKATQMGHNYVKAHFDGMGALVGTNLQILSGPVDEQMKVAYGRMKKGADGIGAAVNDKLGFSRTGAGADGKGAGSGSGSGAGRGGVGGTVADWAQDPMRAVTNTYLAGWPEGNKQAMLRGTAGTAASAMMSMGFTREAMEIEAGTMISQSRAGLASYQTGAREDSAKVMASRYRAAAEQQANESVWQSQRDLGAQYTSHFAALGATPGRYSAGPKATNMEGMAGMGLLGNDSSVNLETGELTQNNETGFQGLFQSLDYNTPGSAFQVKVDEGRRELSYQINGMDADLNGNPVQATAQAMQAEAQQKGWQLTNALTGTSITNNVSNAFAGTANHATGGQGNYFTDNGNGTYNNIETGDALQLSSQFGQTLADQSMRDKDGNVIGIAKYSHGLVVGAVDPNMNSTSTTGIIVKSGIESSQREGEEATSVLASQAVIQADLVAGSAAIVSGQQYTPVSGSDNPILQHHKAPTAPAPNGHPANPVPNQTEEDED